jgi:hypothetical protein
LHSIPIAKFIFGLGRSRQQVSSLHHQNILQNAQAKKVKPLSMDSLEKLDKKGIYIGDEARIFTQINRMG